MTSSSNRHGPINYFQAQKNMVNNYDRTSRRVMNTLIAGMLSQSIHITSTGQGHNTKVK